MRDEGISTIIIHFSHLLHALAPQRGKGSAPLRLVEKIKERSEWNWRGASRLSPRFVHYNH